jgi:UDP-glucose 4-epimerase
VSYPGPICLIGGTGFLGSALRRHLRNFDSELVVAGRAREAPFEKGERYVAASDLLQPASNTCEHFSAIIDFAYATVPSTSFEDPIADVSANLGPLIGHLQLAQRVQAGRFVFISSGGTVYGDVGAAPIPESTPNAPISPYGITKLACEHYVRLFHSLHGVPAVIVRPSNIYGPGQLPFRGQGLVATAFGAVLRNKPLTVYGDGSQVRDFLYVEDFCTGLLAVLEKGTPGEIYNLGSGVGISVAYTLAAIDKIVQRDGRSLDIDWREPRPFDVKSNILDTAKLSGASGWAPATSLEEGLSATWEWIKSQ